jgi:hypothetical protein
VSAIDNLEKLMMDTKECLGREVHSFRDEVISRLDLQAARLERQTMLWETGRRWSDGIDTWAAKIEAALETKDRQIADLAGRIDEPDGTERLLVTP